MFDVFRRSAAIRLSVLAGAAALALGGLGATAQAFPAGPAASGASGATAVQYLGDGYRLHGGHHRHRLGANYHPNHPGFAGHYDCGPGGKATRLSRKFCGGNDRFAHLNRHGFYD